jgi:hypothetical protein
MLSFFKTLLVWLCILSLPVQGLAAVTRLSCGPAHHQALVPASQAHEAHEHLAGHHMDGMDHDHGMHQAQHQGADKKCSVCASCCAGLGLVASFPQWPVALQASPALVATFKSLLPSFLPEGLERPPRSAIA